ncbi:hypothetical protein D3C73_1350320 [compost metagenome]
MLHQRIVDQSVLGRNLGGCEACRAGQQLVSFKDRDLIAGLRQQVSRCYTGDPAADDGYLGRMILCQSWKRRQLRCFSP